MCRLGTSTQLTCLHMVNANMCMVGQNKRTTFTVGILQATRAEASRVCTVRHITTSAIDLAEPRRKNNFTRRGAYMLFVKPQFCKRLASQFQHRVQVRNHHPDQIRGPKKTARVFFWYTGPFWIHTHMHYTYLYPAVLTLLVVLGLLGLSHADQIHHILCDHNLTQHNTPAVQLPPQFDTSTHG